MRAARRGRARRSGRCRSTSPGQPQRAPPADDPRSVLRALGGSIETALRSRWVLRFRGVALAVAHIDDPNRAIGAAGDVPLAVGAHGEAAHFSPVALPLEHFLAGVDVPAASVPLLVTR